MGIMAKTTSSSNAPITQTFFVTVWHLLRRYPVQTIVILIVIRFLYRRYFSPLRRYPGPFLASGSRLYALYTTWKGQTHDEQIKLHQRYGPIVRIKPNQLSFSSPEAARQVLAPGKGYSKTDFYWVFPPYNNPDIFTEIREEVHAQKKRFTNVPYSLASFQALTPWINKTVNVFCDKLDLFSQTSQKMDLGKYLQYAAFDSLGEVAFSTNFGFLDNGVDVNGAIELIDSVQLYDGIVGQVPFLDYLLRRSPLWDYLPWTTPLGNNHITRTALGQLAARKDGTAIVDRRDLLSQLLEGHKKDPVKFSEMDVFAVAHGAIFAGSDSTSSTMTSFVWHVLNNPKVHAKLVQEILNVDTKGDLSEVVAWDEAQNKLPYFQACLKEAMRINPAVGLPLYRKVPATGADIDGEFVAGGTEIALNGWVLHRDQTIFGKDAESFRPERWLASEKDEKNQDRVKKMERYMFQVSSNQSGAHSWRHANTISLVRRRLSRMHRP